MKMKNIVFASALALSSFAIASVPSIPAENQPETVAQGEYPAVGSSYDVDFGIMKGRAEVISESRMRFTSEDKSINDTIEMKVTPLRKNLFLVSWQDREGNVTIMIQDFTRHVLYSNMVNSSQGQLQLTQVKGTFRKVQSTQ